MSRKQVFELRMASHNNDSGLLIGKFPEPIVPAFQASNQAQDEVNMYVKVEEMQEDDVLEVTSTNQHDIVEAKGIDMKSKKRKKRYQKKSEIILEQDTTTSASTSTSTSGVAKPINWVGSRVDTSVETTSSSVASSAGPKYAILQIMTSGSGEKHVNVLHVGDWFSFSRPSSARTMVTLDDVNAEFEKQQRAQQESNKRYNKLVSTYRSKKGGGGDDDAEGTADEVPLAFGKASTSGRGGGTKHLTDGGMDVDSKDDNNWQDLDMATNVSDDEDDTGNIQAYDNEQEERVADILDAYADSSADESDDDEEKEEEKAAAEKKEQLEQAQASLRHLEGGAGQLESAMEFKHKVLTSLKVTESNKRKLDMVDNEESSMGGKGSVDKNGNNLKKGKHVSIAQDVTAQSSSSSSSSPSYSSKASTTVLNEDNVRAYMKRQGGRVQSKVLKKEFKKAMKDLGASAKDVFRTIVIKLTKIEEDSVLGSMLVLK